MSTGRISRAKYAAQELPLLVGPVVRLEHAQAVLGQSVAALARMPAALLGDHAVGAAADRRRVAREGVMPAGSRRRTPADRCCISPATRIMKNSSRFELTMARNFSRSKSGRSSDKPFAQHAVVELQPAQLAVDVQLGDLRSFGHAFCSSAWCNMQSA